MKFNYRKIASVLASTVMLSSTVAFAAAATLPAPFVQSGKADVAIVYGSNPLASATDLAAVTEIESYLNSKVSAQATPGTSSSGATVTGGDSVSLSKDNSKINLGENLNAVYTNLDDDELSTVLKAGIYEDEPGTNYDYKQKITLDALPLIHFADSEVNENEEPVIGFDIQSNTEIMNYTLDFTDTPANSSAIMETTTIEMLGREYYISDVDATGANLKLTLLDTANTAIVTEGETTTVTVGSQTFEVGIIGVEDANTAVLSVDGNKINSLDEGQSRKIADDTYLSVKDVVYNAKDSGISSVEFSIGTGQIVLEDTSLVKINDESVDELTVDLTGTQGKLSQIKLTWKADDETFLVPGMDLALPGFETIKLSMAGFVATEPETLRVENSGDDYMEVKNIELKDGTVSSLPLLYANSTNTGFSQLGKDSDDLLITARAGNNTLNLNESLHTYFATTYQSGDNSESYIFELVSVNEEDSGVKNVTKLKNLADGTTTEFSNDDDVDFGEVNIAITGANGDLGIATLTATHSGSATNVYLDRVITKSGLSFRLPVIANSTAADGGDGFINISGVTRNATDIDVGLNDSTSWRMVFTEGDEDNNNFGIGAGGKNFNVTLNFGGTDSKVQVGSLSVYPQLKLNEDSDDIEAYVNGSGSHATKLVLRDEAQDTLEIEYHGVEAYADLFVAESAAVIGGGSGETGVMKLKDSEVTSSTNKNLIVVGGSCINTVAAELLGVSYPTCGAAWESSTSVGAGSFLIQTFARSGKVATLVAGYDAGDTTKAAKAFTTQVVDTTVGKKYTSSVETSLTAAL